METKTNVAVCVPFLVVENIERTIEWYEGVGFTCTETNHVWEPDGELNWARIEWNGAAFMIGPDQRHVRSKTKDAGLWFDVASLDWIVEHLKGNHIPFNTEEESFYGKKLISFKDINGFVVSFSSELPDK